MKDVIVQLNIFPSSYIVNREFIYSFFVCVSWGGGGRGAGAGAGAV